MYLLPARILPGSKYNPNTIDPCLPVCLSAHVSGPECTCTYSSECGCSLSRHDIYNISIRSDFPVRRGREGNGRERSESVRDRRKEGGVESYVLGLQPDYYIDLYLCSIGNPSTWLNAV